MAAPPARPGQASASPGGEGGDLEALARALAAAPEARIRHVAEVV